MRHDSDAGVKEAGRALLVVLACLGAGCARVASDPLFAPERLAPTAASRPWTPPSAPEGLADGVAGGDPAPPPRAWQAPGRVLPVPGERHDLASLLGVALSGNPATREAWEQARAAAARYGRSRSEWLPEISFETQVGPERVLFQDSPNPLTVHQNTYDLQFTMAWTLIDFGRRTQADEQARQELLAANYSFNRKIQDVVFDLQRAYYALDAAMGMVRAAEQNLELAASVGETAEKRMSVGLATRPEVLLAVQTEAKARYDLERARVLVSDAQAALAVALGLPANRPVEIEEIPDLDVTDVVAESVDALVDRALEQRPDLAAQAAELRASEAAVERARADFLPTIGFAGNWGPSFWDYTIDGMPRDFTSSPQYAATGTFSWDLFRGFDRVNALREARANADSAREKLAAAEIGAAAEVWRAYHQYRSSVRQLEFAEALLRASRDAYDATFRSYGVGLSTIVELLTAEQDLARARYTRIEARAGLLTSAARVAYSVGALGPPG